MFDEQMEAVISWPFEFVLKKPATVFGEDYSKITLREPNADDAVEFGVIGMSGDEMLDVIAHLSGLTPATVRALPSSDMLRLSKTLMRDFLQGGRSTTFRGWAAPIASRCYRGLSKDVH